MAAVNATNARTLVIDDDLTSKQQRNLEEALSANGGADVKVPSSLISSLLLLPSLLCNLPRYCCINLIDDLLPYECHPLSLLLH